MYIRILILFTLCFNSSFSQKDIFFPFKTENNWITIHNNKKIIHPQVYDYVNYYDKFGYAYFIANKKYGIIDSIGNASNSDWNNAYSKGFPKIIPIYVMSWHLFGLISNNGFIDSKI